MIIKSPVDIQQVFFSINEDNEGKSSQYRDTKVVCTGGSIWSNRLLLVLAFPLIENPLSLLQDEIDPVILMPDFTSQEVRSELYRFYSQPETNGHDQLLESIGELADIDSTVKYETDIKKEMVEVSVIEPCYKCKMVAFQNFDERELHVGSCQFIFKCRYCKNTFKSKIEKLSHEENHKNEDGQYKCNFVVCQGRLFSNKRRYVRHIKEVHESEKSSTHTCLFCDKTFQGLAIYKRHMKKYKKGPKDYRCPEDNCDSRFKSRISLLDHLRRHRGEFPYACEVCGSSFTTKWTRLSHMKSHEPNAKPPIPCMCHICSRIFNNKSSLNHHLSTFHVDKKDYKHKCDGCPKSFARKNELNRHMVTHSGIRNFTCATCGKKFLTKPTMDQHERIHTGERPYRCTFCGKGFVTQNKVKRHEVVHTGALDFSCSVCGKKFNQKTNRNVHEKKCQSDGVDNTPTIF